jgi:hypothetical protein
VEPGHSAGSTEAVQQHRGDISRKRRQPTQAVRTMDRISTISDTTRVRPPADTTTDVCWCGQDMDHVPGGHCPRCGTARAAHVDAHLPRLAA